eukprot:GEMP01043263.1.p1 GENE.GEMP01043263.1~~GEMP01043263.1.p1  ORF type:complete len:438 (+),score=81.57 GEMP01043263.1:85-1398(+)
MTLGSDDVIPVIRSPDDENNCVQKAVFGDNVIYFGKLFSGPGALPALGTFLLITVPMILFHAMESPTLVELRSGWILVVLVLILHLVAVVFLFLTTFTDPGILPRRPALDEYRESPPAFLDIVLQGHHVRIKWCRTCHVYRPPRSTHCSTCDNCVEDFDHHCPWVGNCVGRRNYRQFVIFLTSTGVLTLLVLILCIVNFVTFATIEDKSVKDLFLSKIIAFLVGLFTFVMVWFVGALCGFHTYLLSTNQTTYEQVKATKHWTRSPFYRGIRSHARRFWNSARKSFIKLSDRTCINHPSFDPANALLLPHASAVPASPPCTSGSSDASSEHASPSISIVVGDSTAQDSLTATQNNSEFPRKSKSRKKKTRRVLRPQDQARADSSRPASRTGSPRSGGKTTKKSRRTDPTRSGRAQLSARQASIHTDVALSQRELMMGH